MNSLQKFGSVASGVLMLITGLILVFMPDDGTFYVALILAITLFLIGMRLLIYYFTMARRMVGGRSVLLLGIFLLDFCAFTVTILDEPRVIVILYLVGWHGFSGLVSLLRAREAKLHKGNWKFKAANGVVNILVVIGCICFVKNPAMLTLIYSYISSDTRRASCGDQEGAERHNDIIQKEPSRFFGHGSFFCIYVFNCVHHMGKNI